jgi:hypothetical protein
MDDLVWTEIDGAVCDTCGSSAFDPLHLCHLEPVETDGMASALTPTRRSPEEAIERSRSGDLNEDCRKAKAVRRSSWKMSCRCTPSTCEHRYIQIGPSEEDILWERCGKFSCPYCGPRAAEEFEFAARRSRPTHRLELWGVHGEFVSIRKRINRALYEMRDPVRIQAAWYRVDDGPGGCGVLLWLHSWHGPVTSEAVWRGVRRYFPSADDSLRLLDWTDAPDRLLPGSIVPIPSSVSVAREAMRSHLAANGGRSILHATPRFWRWGTGSLTREQARAQARFVLDSPRRGR